MSMKSSGRGAPVGRRASTIWRFSGVVIGAPRRAMEAVADARTELRVVAHLVAIQPEPDHGTGEGWRQMAAPGGHEIEHGGRRRDERGVEAPQRGDRPVVDVDDAPGQRIEEKIVLLVHPAEGAGRKLDRLRHATTRAARSRAISSARPASLRTASVCSPSCGAGVRIVPGVRPNRTGVPRFVNLPARGCVSGTSMPVAATWGSLVRSA